MIAGIGTDIVEIARIKEMVSRHGAAFLQRIFTPEELREAEVRKDALSYYAGRWAVKEALSKALGCGIGEKCAWQEITTLNRKNGRPDTVLSGIAAATAQSLGVGIIHVSISHEQAYACASVVLESVASQ